MKILVTGTAGFIGFHVVKRLLEGEGKIIGLDNINDYYDVNLKYARLKETGINKKEIVYGKLISSQYKNYQFIKLNLEDREQITNLFKTEKFDIVCNFAAQAGVRHSITNPFAYIESNIVGFMNILESCRNFNIKQLLYASSSSVYGMNKEIPFSTKHKTEKPVSLYAATKKSNELMAYSYSHLFKLKTIGLRFFTVYGPWGRPDMAYFSFTKAIYENKSIKIFNKGEMERDFTYIDDITDGILRIITKIRNKETVDQDNLAQLYNIGNNKPVKLLYFIEKLEEMIGKKAKKEFLPMQKGDVYRTYADISGLENNFGYKPNTLIENGLRKFVDWYKLFYNK